MLRIALRGHRSALLWVGGFGALFMRHTSGLGD